MIDQDAGRLAGYGTWDHLSSVGSRANRHLQIAWFGVDAAYQGATDHEDRRVADVIYATVEEAALADPRSHDDMPFTLVCHVENERGLRFWRRQGYGVIADRRAQVEDEVYYRMVR